MGGSYGWRRIRGADGQPWEIIDGKKRLVEMDGWKKTDERERGGRERMGRRDG